MDQLDHEHLDVYQRALEFLAATMKVLEQLPRGSELADQLRRASLSIPLSIAEGSGKTTSRDKARFYAIARGSAMECGAVLDVCRITKQGEPDAIQAGKALLVRIVSMLTKMTRPTN